MFETELALLSQGKFSEILTNVQSKNLTKSDDRHLSFLEHLYINEDMKEALNSGNPDAKALFAQVITQSAPKHRLRVLEYCIKQQRHALIKMILDKDQSLLIARGQSGLNPLGLAMQGYRDSPTKLSLSIVNQIYFSCPRGDRRGTIVDQSVSLEGAWLRHPIWEYGVEFCLKYDAQHWPVGIDLDWLDLVIQTIDDGLYVYGGVPVDRELFKDYVRHQHGAQVYGMLFEALRTLSAGLPGRTNAQTKANATLATYSEFTSRAGGAQPTNSGISLQPVKRSSYSTLSFLHKKPATQSSEKQPPKPEGDSPGPADGGPSP